MHILQRGWPILARPAIPINLTKSLGPGIPSLHSHFHINLVSLATMDVRIRGAAGGNFLITFTMCSVQSVIQI